MSILRDLRKKHDMNQQTLGNLIGVSKSTICKYENGTVEISPSVIDKLCEIFDVTADYLLGRVTEDDFDDTFESKAGDYVGVPLLGKVHAGMPMLAAESIEEYLPCSSHEVSGGDYFYMEVEGDCMTGDFIPEGALVLVKKQPQVHNNDIAVVRVEDEVVLRHVKFVGDSIVLVPSNTAYEPLIITGGDVEIIGLVVEVRFKV